MNITKIKYSIAAAIIAIATAFCGCGGKEEENVALKSFDDTVLTSEPANDPAADDDPEKQQSLIRVYVCGAVRSPDVYELEKDERVIDAVEAAGGFTADAGYEYLNLALRLSDGQKIYVPTADEIEDALAAGDQMVTAEVNITSNSPGIDSSYDGTDKDNSSNSEGKSGGKVDINRADKQTLMTLPGIGESKAEKIIAYREENGPFSSIEDIMLVGGIKEGLFNKVRDSICAN